MGRDRLGHGKDVFWLERSKDVDNKTEWDGSRNTFAPQRIYRKHEGMRSLMVIGWSAPRLIRVAGSGYSSP